MPSSDSRLVAERDGVRLIITPRAQIGCGDLINQPQAKQLIEGIEIEPIIQYPDERGLFAELFRLGENGIARDYTPEHGAKVQFSFTISYAGVIKAIHYHFEQTDLWAPLTGMFQVFLYDLREKSATCGKLNTIFVGAQRPWKIRIPPGVGHGYRIVGPDSGMLVYATNRVYNPKDEGRIAFDDPGINYDWVTRPK